MKQVLIFINLICITLRRRRKSLLHFWNAKREWQRGRLPVQIVVFVAETIIRMERFPVRCVLRRYYNLLYAFLIIKRPNVLDSRKSLRCLAKDSGSKGGIQRAQRAIALHSVCGHWASFFSSQRKFLIPTR